MTTKDLMLRVVRMYSGEPPLKFQEIADALRSEDPSISITPTKAGEIVREACGWLLRQQQKLEDIQRRQLLSEELQHALREKYPVLIGAKVIRCAPVKTPLDYRNLERIMAQVAAEYFDELLGVLEHRRTNIEIFEVILSGGESVLDMVSCLPEIPRPNIRFHPAALIGRGRMLQSTHIGPETTATIAWSRSGRKSGHLIYATVSPDDNGFIGYGNGPSEADPQKQAKRLNDIQECLLDMSKGDAVAAVLKDLPHAHLAVVTLGLLDPSTSEEADRFSMIGLVKGLGLSPSLLAKDGVIGDISYCLIRRDGSTKPEWNLFLTPEYKKMTAVEFYQDMVRNGEPVMVIAGTHKEELLLAALTGELINVLITDEHTARTLIQTP